MKNKETEVSSTYRHIGNGGVNFSVVDDPDFGATVVIEANHFGQQTHQMRLHTDPETLEKLGSSFLLASKHAFKGQPYCYAARVSGE